MTQHDDTLVLAVPKGRILDELQPLLAKANITPEPAFFDKNARQLRFKTNDPKLDIIRVRSFDVVTFVLHGAAALGIAGRDVLMEFDNDEIYAPLDLKIGKCRLAIAAHNSKATAGLQRNSHITVATKYPKVSQEYFAQKGIQAECIKLNGAMELAPAMGVSEYIVDLVSTGKTLKENDLKEVTTIADISSYLIIGRSTFKTRSKRIDDLIKKLK